MSEIIGRRSFITGLISLVAAPAIVRAGSLMPVRVIEPAIRYRTISLEEMMERLLDHIEREINPPYGISPAMQALRYLDEHDGIMARIISTDEYLVGR